MGLERLLAQIKVATPCIRRKPRATAMVSRATLTQALHKHTKYGGRDCRGQQKTEDLLKMGVQIRAAQGSKSSRLGTARWHLRFANQRVHEMIEAPCLSS